MPSTPIKWRDLNQADLAEEIRLLDETMAVIEDLDSKARTASMMLEGSVDGSMKKYGGELWQVLREMKVIHYDRSVLEEIEV